MDSILKRQSFIQGMHTDLTYFDHLSLQCNSEQAPAVRSPTCAVPPSMVFADQFTDFLCSIYSRLEAERSYVASQCSGLEKLRRHDAATATLPGLIKYVRLFWRKEVFQRRHAKGELMRT